MSETQRLEDLEAAVRNLERELQALRAELNRLSAPSAATFAPSGPLTEPRAAAPSDLGLDPPSPAQAPVANAELSIQPSTSASAGHSLDWSMPCPGSPGGTPSTLRDLPPTSVSKRLVGSFRVVAVSAPTML